MSEIDVQNAKQIRDPMDVLISMDVVDDTVNLTFSGYSNAKIADGILNEPTWPMRKLADLQGEGFPLDGSCALYSPDITPSRTNRKIGVRGNTGEVVSVTVTGNKVINMITIFATGAESVTFGETTTNFISGTVTIPVESESIELIFNPAKQTERVEISEISAGAKFRITRDNLIRATVSLRSDLSIKDPTLPESEINIEFYQDTDISSAIAEIPEDTPLVYSAGYTGDMSPERHFYVSGQVTWADNIVTLHAVDGVHFLEKNFGAPAVLYGWDSDQAAEAYSLMVCMVLNEVPNARYQSIYNSAEFKQRYAIINNEITYREFIAELMNLFHATDSRGDQFWPVFVDAGIPRVKVSFPEPQSRIREEDCGRIVRNTERKITSVDVIYNDIDVAYPTIVGNGRWTKNVGVTLEFNMFASDYLVGFPMFSPYAEEYEKKLFSIYGWYSPRYWTFPIAPVNKDGECLQAYHQYYSSKTHEGGTLDLMAFPGAGAVNFKSTPEDGWDWNGIYPQFIPWSAKYDIGWDIYPVTFTSQNTAWNEMTKCGVIAKGAESAEVFIVGRGYNFIENKTSYSSGDGGINETIETKAFSGTFQKYIRSRGVYYDVFPGEGIRELLRRSNVTGSFLWKGDPRLQPRDVVEFERLNGTVQEITIENITITHEGGGTYAEITYREGIV